MQCLWKQPTTLIITWNYAVYLTAHGHCTENVIVFVVVQRYQNRTLLYQ